MTDSELHEIETRRDNLTVYWNICQAHQDIEDLVLEIKRLRARLAGPLKPTIPEVHLRAAG